MAAINEYLPYSSDSTWIWSVATNTSNITGQAAEILLPTLWREVKERTFWTSWIGGKDSPLEANVNLTKDKGDLMHFYLASALDNAPVDLRYTVKEKADITTIYQDSVKLGLIRNAMEIDLPMSEQRAVFNMRVTMKDLLVQWLVDEGPEKMITRKLSGSTYVDSNSATIGEAGTANTNIMYGGTATGTGNITETDKLTIDLLYQARESAETGQLNGTTKRKVRPCTLQTGGYGYRAAFHPYQIYDLTKSDGWKDIFQLDVRGSQNQLIRGEGNLPEMQPYAPFARVDDIEIYSYRGITTASTWGVGGDVNGATGLFMGAQAGLLAKAMGPEWVEFTNDTKEKFGVRCSVVMGFDKASFNSIDNGLIAMKTAAKYHYVRAS